MVTYDMSDTRICSEKNISIIIMTWMSCVHKSSGNVTMTMARVQCKEDYKIIFKKKIINVQLIRFMVLNAEYIHLLA